MISNLRALSLEFDSVSSLLSRFKDSSCKVSFFSVDFPVMTFFTTALTDFELSTYFRTKNGINSSSSTSVALFSRKFAAHVRQTNPL